jgi:hypothetical protein
MKTSNDDGYDTHEVDLDRESKYQKNLEDLRQWASDLEEENGSAAGLLAWAAFEIASRREQAAEYARAWTDATGETIDEYGFTPGSIRGRVAALADVVRKLEKKTKTPIILIRVGDDLLGETLVRTIVAEIIYESVQARISMRYDPDPDRSNWENHIDAVEKAKAVIGVQRFSCVWKTDDMSIWRTLEGDPPEHEIDTSPF